MEINRVIIGDPAAPILTFDNDSIESITEDASVSMVGAELSIDQFVPIVRYELIIRYVIVPADIEDYQRILTADGYVLCGRYNYDIRAIPYGTPVRFYVGSRITGLYYLSSIDRIGRETFKVNCVSAVGLMDKQWHAGGVYTGQRFDWLVSDIVGPEYDYTIEPEVASLQVYGWLPYATKRQNLHQLLLAYGVNITKSDLGGMLFTFIRATDFYTIPSERIYESGSVLYGEPASRVEVVEHAYHYMPNAEMVTLFDTQGNAVENTVVTFDQPIYADSVTVEDGGSLEILERGVNYAIVNGSGVLIGRPYVHTTRRMIAINDEAATEKVVTVEDATLITMATSDNCLVRISEYYFHATEVRNTIVLADEKPGKRYVFDNAFLEHTNAFMTSMSMSTSNITSAECEYIDGYIPIAQGGSFMRRDILPLKNEEQTWNVPETVYQKDVPQIRVVLIGAGYDGKNGVAGEPGVEATDDAGGAGGKGGAGGAGGKGGKVLSATINCSNIAFLKYGRSGKNTYIRGGNLFYSSADGVSSETGYVELFTGAVYALPGTNGVAGADGGIGGSYPPIGSSGNFAKDGDDLTVDDEKYKGGKAGKRSIVNGGFGNIHENLKLYFGGSGGGGAAYGNDGHDGSTGLWNDDNGDLIVQPGGDGADGASTVPTTKMYGCGGNGGSGGGGGGGGGSLHYWNYVYNTLIAIDHWNPGAGGKPGKGTAGYEGVVIIYY